MKDAGENPEEWFNKNKLLVLAKLVKKDGTVTNIVTGN
jgi:hypothetical protein